MIRYALAALALAVAASAQDPSTARWSARAEKAEGLKSLVVSASAGPVTVTAASKTKEVFFEKEGKDESDCLFTVERVGEELRIRSDGKMSIRSCRVGWKVTAPKTLAIKAASGAGGVTVKGFSGAVEAKTGSGPVVLEGLKSSVDAQTGSGDITATGLAGDFKGETGSGSITAAFSSAPKRIEAQTGSGNIQLTLPKGISVDLVQRTGSGDVKSSFGHDPKGNTKIVVKTGSGDISITDAK